MTAAGHGPNIGHGFVKYVIIDANGVELPPVVFPAQIAPAGRIVSGALEAATRVAAAGDLWWVGSDAMFAPSPITLLAQERLRDPAFIPALLRGALDQFGPAGVAGGVCVTGLPASWSEDRALAAQLGQRLREATTAYDRIRVIAEPLGLMYAALLDNHGEIAGDPALGAGRVGVVDLGHHSVDIAVLRRSQPEPASLDTWMLGTARPLAEIRSRLAAAYDRELTIYEADLVVRAGAALVAGERWSLPVGWDRPLLDNAQAIIARLRERWGGGGALDAILVGGGGAELPHLAEAIRAAYPHSMVVADPQTAIARGYARLARRTARAA